ncbi:hypothetical protein T484DRAFT_1796161 [Baffinella frigidus]|nr:hypothetical protein T484DRAFT_1796161 [Cryptophyta sp. CCMP2293]
MIAARAVDPTAAADHLAKKREVLLDGLDGLSVSVSGAGKKAALKREGVLLVEKGALRIKLAQGRSFALVAFVSDLGHTVASEQEAKERVFVPTNETLAAYETSVSGYGRMKLVDGTHCWIEFDAGDWYKGKIAGYDQGSAKYKVVFPDGEESDQLDP